MTPTSVMSSSFDAVTTPPDSRSKAMRRAGYILSALSVLFLLMDAGMKLLALPVVLTSTAQLGYPGTPEFAQLLGGILLVSTALYVIPRTSIFGAVLLTAYLGAAVATHIRVGNPLATHVLSGVYLAIFVWGGLLLRDTRLRTLFPWRR